MKIAIIGAGSSYTPELATGLIEHEKELDLDVVACYDIDGWRLGVVTGFCRRMASARGASFKFEQTLDVEQALDGASFVLTQIRVGGQKARHTDIRLGLDNDLIGQETTGIGGFAKAMRTIPVMIDLCRRMEARCPEAWLVNFTNPSGLVTEALLRHGRERVVGLCNIPINLHHDVAALLGVEPWRVEIDSLGLNHLSWVRGIKVDGREMLPELFDRVLAAGLPANLSDELDYPPEFLQALGMIPSGYLRYYYLRRRMLRKLKARPRTRAEQVMEIEKRLFAWYADESRTDPPPELASRGGALYSRAAIDVVLSLLLDRKDRQVLDVRNCGALDCLPDDCVVEVPCIVGRAGPVPIGQQPVPWKVRGLINQVKSYELLAVEAAVKLDRGTAVLALVNNPLVGDAEVALRLVDRLSELYGIRWRN